MDTPAHKLSEKIIERLVADKLLAAEAGKKLVAKIAEGKLRSEDWHVALDLATGKKVEP